VKDRFFNVDAENLKKLLVEFVCSAAGGGCTYEGRDMKTAHGGMQLVDDEFSAVVEDLSGALDKFNVPAKEKGELLGALGPLKPQMVVSPDQLHPIDEAKLAKVTKLAATLGDPEAKRLLQTAVIAGQRGQRSYAEQLFSRAELITGAKPLASVATVFRAGAPQRIATPTKKLPDAGPQPAVAGKDDEAELPKPKGPIAVLHGKLTIDGKPIQGIGVVMMYGAGGVKRVAKKRVIEQRNKTFAPHVTAVPVGSTISFPNYDDLFHNVFSVSKAKAFDLGLYKNGETREITLDKPGVIRVGCNIHANMSAYIIAVDAPHYTIVDPDGGFLFNTLLPGKYRAQIWLENAAEPLTSEVQIKQGDNQLSLDLKGGGGGVSPDKFGAPR
jgi:plastocyanin